MQYTDFNFLLTSSNFAFSLFILICLVLFRFVYGKSVCVCVCVSWCESACVAATAFGRKGSFWAGMLLSVQPAPSLRKAVGLIPSTGKKVFLRVGIFTLRHTF
jgi:hypothetical protein